MYEHNITRPYSTIEFHEVRNWILNTKQEKEKLKQTSLGENNMIYESITILSTFLNKSFSRT